MKDTFFKQLIKFLFLLLLALNVFSAGNESDSLLLETLDDVLIEEYKPCSDESDISSFEVSTISSLMIVSEGSFFTEGEVITSSSGVQAIVESYDVETQKLTFHQDANTGFETFLLNETITGSSSEIATVKEFIIDLTIPCSELIVSIEEEPQQMIFTSKESAEEAKASATSTAAEMMAEIEEELARKAALEAFQKKLAKERADAAASTAAYQSKLTYDAMVEELMEALAIEQEIAAFEAKLAAEMTAAEMMAEIEEELARKAALEAFQKKLAKERADAAASTAAYQSKLTYDAMVEELMEALAIEQEIAAFEAKLAAEMTAAEMMAEIEEELARKAALEAFQKKLAKERADAAASTAAYQSKLTYDAMVEELMEALAIEQEIAAFEAKLAADLASDTLDRELTEFEAQLEEDLSNQAALAKFLAKLAEERAAAEASTAAYQAKVAYDARVAKIKEDLVRQLEEVVEPDDYKSHLVEELIAQATAKLEEEKFIGAISGEIVTVAIHKFCKDTLNLSDSNIALFKKALAGGYLGNVGPQVKHGTEFTPNRWDKYITCVGSLGN